MTALYRVEDGGHIAVGSDTHGPWDPQLQHGSCPAAFAVWAAETLPTAQPMRVARLTIDLMRPVPIAPLTYTAEVVRDGRKIQLVSVRMMAQGTEIVRASVLKLRRGPAALADAAAEDPLDRPLPDLSNPAQDAQGMAQGFNRHMTLRVVKGGWFATGPASVWFRANTPIVAGHALSQPMRAVIAADYCNATSPLTGFREWTFVNADLTVSLARDPVGEWVLLDGQTYAGPDGGAIAFARLADTQGYFGRAVQTVVLERR